MKNCPLCGEEIQAAALVCKHCGAQASSTGWVHPSSRATMQPTSTNGFAIASLVLGILWLYWVGSVLALVFGYVALGSIKRSGDTEKGKGLAIAGVVLGWIGVATLLIVIFFAVVVANESNY